MNAGLKLYYWERVDMVSNYGPGSCIALADGKGTAARICAAKHCVDGVDFRVIEDAINNPELKNLINTDIITNYNKMVDELLSIEVEIIEGEFGCVIYGTE